VPTRSSSRCRALLAAVLYGLGLLGPASAEGLNSARCCTCILIEGEAVPWAPAAQLKPIGDIIRAPSGARDMLDDAGKKEGNRKAMKAR
jgi:hypothetical protein